MEKTKNARPKGFGKRMLAAFLAVVFAFNGLHLSLTPDDAYALSVPQQVSDFETDIPGTGIFLKDFNWNTADIQLKAGYVVDPAFEGDPTRPFIKYVGTIAANTTFYDEYPFSVQFHDVGFAADGRSVDFLYKVKSVYVSTEERIDDVGLFTLYNLSAPGVGSDLEALSWAKRDNGTVDVWNMYATMDVDVEMTYSDTGELVNERYQFAVADLDQPHRSKAKPVDWDGPGVEQITFLSGVDDTTYVLNGTLLKYSPASSYANYRGSANTGGPGEPPETFSTVVGYISSGAASFNWAGSRCGTVLFGKYFNYPTPTTGSLGATKVLAHAPLTAGAYSFQLKDSEGTVLQTKTNSATGGVAFDAFTYALPGTYTYSISEVPGSDSSITYDTDVYEATVVVALNTETNALFISSISYKNLTTGETIEAGAQPVFTNTSSLSSKSSDPISGTVVEAGSEIDYAVSYENLTGAAATVTIIDPVPAYTAYKAGSANTLNGITGVLMPAYSAPGKWYDGRDCVVWTDVPLAIGEKATAEFTVLVDDDARGVVVENTAHIAPSNVPDFDTNTVYHPVDPKAADPESGTAVEAGSEIEYSILWKNTTGADATVTITDSVPAHTSFVSASPTPSTLPEVGGTGALQWIIDVPAGEEVEVKFTVKVDANAQGEIIENTAHINPTNQPEFDTNTTKHPVAPKSSDPVSGTAVEAGSEIAYSVAYENLTGENSSVTIIDPVPAYTSYVANSATTVKGVTGVLMPAYSAPGKWYDGRDCVVWENVSVTAGEKIVVGFSARVDDDARGVIVENTAHIVPENAPEFDTNTTHHPVDPKISDPATGTAVEVGSEIEYTLTYRNTTDAPVTVTITDNTPEFTTFVSATQDPATKPAVGATGKVEWNKTVAADATLEVKFTVKVAEDAKGKIVDNVAHFAPSNSPEFDTNHTQHPVDPKTANPVSGTAVEAGSEIEYTLTYKNTSDAPVSVTVTDNTPEFTTFVSASDSPSTAPVAGGTGKVEWVKTVGAGDTLTVTFKAKVDEDAQGKVVDNVAHIAPSNQPAFDTNHTYHPVDPKTATPVSGTAVEAGTEIEYTLTYKNTSGEDAMVTITDNTPEFTTFVSASDSPAPNTMPDAGGTGKIEWVNVPVAKDGTVVVTFKVKVNEDAQGTIIDNVAHIAPSNMPEFDTNPVYHPVDPKTSDPVSGTAVEAGSDITYTLTYENTSADPVTVTITDAVPEHTTYVSATGTPTAEPTVGGTGTVTWENVPVAAKGKLIVTFTVKVDDDAKGVVIDNVAHIAPSNMPDFDTNHTYHPVDPKSASPADGTVVEAGSNITYTLTYKNTSSESVKVTVTDSTPAFTTFVSASGDPGTKPAVGGTGEIKWTDVLVRPGDTLTLAFVVKVNEDAKGALVENIAHFSPSNSPEFDTNPVYHPVDPKTANPATGTAVEAGSEIEYTLTYQNTTGEDATVTITDATPEFTTFVSATQDPTTKPAVGSTGTVEWKDVEVKDGETVTVTFKVKVDEDAQGEVVDNVAHIAPSNRPEYDTNHTYHPVDPKTANPATGTAIEAGSEITYTLTYKNMTGGAADVTITDATPAATTFVSASDDPTTVPAVGESGTVEWANVPVAADGTVTVSFTVKVDDDAQGVLVENVAHFNPSNAPEFDSNPTIHPVDPKTSNPVTGTAVEAGSEIEYTLTYQNTTGKDATVTIADATPKFTTFVSATQDPTTKPAAGNPGIVEWKNLPVRDGETVTVTFKVKVDLDAQGKVIDNVAHITPENSPEYDTNHTYHPVDPKTADPVDGTAVEAGSEIEYTLTYKNTSADDVTVTITDATPEFTTFVSATGSPATKPTVGSTGPVEWKDVPVSAGGTLEVTFKVKVNDDAKGTIIENTAHIAPSNTPSFDTNTIHHPVDPKTADPADGTAVEAGSEIAYTLTYKNTSADDVTVTITDATPEFTTFVSATGAPTTQPAAGATGKVEWKDVPVPAGETVEVTFTVKVDDDAQGVLVDNTAHFNPSNAPEYDSNTVYHPVDPKVSDPVSGTAVEAGSEIAYTLTYRNTSADDVTVTITDGTPEFTTFVSATGAPTTQPAAGATGKVEWKDVPVVAGATLEVTFKVKVDLDAQGRLVENTAHISPSNAPEYDTNTTVHPVGPKAADPANNTAVEAGSEITYTLTYMNTTGEAAYVTITDATPAFTTFVSATGGPTTAPAVGATGTVEWEDVPVAIDGIVTVTFTVKVDDDAQGEVIENIAHIAPTNRPVFDTNPTTHPVDPKTSNPVSDTAVEAGSEIAYTLTYKNTSADDVTVTITDGTPEFTTFVSATGAPTTQPAAGATGKVEWKDVPVPAGETVEVTFTVKVDDDAQGEVVENTAHIAPSNSPAYDTNTTYHPVDPKTADPASGTAIEAGKDITYTLTYKNVSADPVKVTITDMVPEFTTYVSATGDPTTEPSAGTRGTIEWKDVSVAAGGTLAVTFTVKVDDDAQGALIDNVAHIAPSNRPAYDTNPTTHPVDPKTSNPVSNTAVEAGSEITYTLTYKNTTDESITVSVSDSTPEYTTFVSATGDPAAKPAVGGTGGIEWKDVPLAAGDTLTVTFTVKVNDDAQGEVVENVAHIAPSNRPDFDTNKTVHPVDPKASNPADGTAVEAGSNITYTLTYKNTSSDDVTVTITDSTPRFTTFVSATGSPTSVPSAGTVGTIEWKDVPVKAGKSVNVAFTVKVDADAKGTRVENTAHINPSNAPEYDTNTTTHPVDPKTANPASGTAVEAGTDITYTLTYKNTSSDDVTVTITDATPAFTTYVSATGSPTVEPAAGSTGTVAWADVPVAAGDTLEVDFTVHVDDNAKGQIVENTAHIAPSNSPAYDTNTTTHPVDPEEPQGVKTSDPAPGTIVETSTKITYYLTYQNVIGEAATVTMVDPIPANTTYVASSATTVNGITGELVKGYSAPGTWYDGRDCVVWKDIPVASGEQVTAGFKVKVMRSARGLDIENTASMVPSNFPAFDTNTIKHPVPRNTNPQGDPDIDENLQAVKSVDKTEAKPGDNITYTITAKNIGEDVLEGIMIRDYIPTYTTYVSSDNDGYYGNVNGKDHVTWLVPILWPGEEIKLSFTVKINADTPENTTIINVALYGAGDDPEDPNDPSKPTNPVETVTPSNPANPSNPGGPKNTGTTSPKTGDEATLSFLLAAAMTAFVVMSSIRVRLWRKQ